MADRPRNILSAHQLLDRYRANKMVGTEEFHVLLPIVSNARSQTGVVRRAMKPLDPDRDEPTRTYEHGDTWITRVKRLEQIGHLPEGMLFALREPTGSDKRAKAAAEIHTELAKQDVRIVTLDDGTAAGTAIVL